MYHVALTQRLAIAYSARCCSRLPHTRGRSVTWSIFLSPEIASHSRPWDRSAIKTFVTTSSTDPSTTTHHHLLTARRTSSTMATQARAHRRGVRLLFVLLLVGVLAMLTHALPVQDDSSKQAKARRSPMPTPLPRILSLNPRSTPDEVYAFYSPRDVYSEGFANSNGLERRGTPTKRQDQPSVPLSSLGPPTFPANIPSCPKCEERYSSLSSCMGASAVFANATSIFTDPVAYINVIKCACTDTFQAVYPQCLVPFTEYASRNRSKARMRIFVSCL